jgi:DNA polymerase V
MERASNVTMDLYRTCLELFEENYEPKTVRKIAVSLSNIVEDSEMQLSLFELEQPKKRELGYVMDTIRGKYGTNALLRAVSYTNAGTAVHRSRLVGGHKA